MTRQSGPVLADLLTRRFSRLVPHADHERHFLRRIESRAGHLHRADSRVISERSEIHAPQFILSGWACRIRELSDSRRQIVGVLLPGDAIGLCARPRPLSLTSIIAVSNLRTVEAPEMLMAWRDRSHLPNLSAALDLLVAEDEFFMLAHIVRLGRQTAYERMAHWLMEIEFRLSTRGLATDGAFAFPLTQENLADVLGLSVVHVNRTLQQMRRESSIELRRSRLVILDRDRLSTAGEFTPPVLSAVHAPPPADREA